MQIRQQILVLLHHAAKWFVENERFPTVRSGGISASSFSRFKLIFSSRSLPRLCQGCCGQVLWQSHLVLPFARREFWCKKSLKRRSLVKPLKTNSGALFENRSQLLREKPTGTFYVRQLSLPAIQNTPWGQRGADEQRRTDERTTAQTD